MTPERTEWIRQALVLTVFSLMVRVVGAALLGEGAPFGPDGTGAEAAVVLGGHPYPLHIALMRVTGLGALDLSMASSTLACVLLWWWGQRVGLTGWLGTGWPGWLSGWLAWPGWLAWLAGWPGWPG